jgi:N-acetylmuramoyl-L-alanine amidase
MTINRKICPPGLKHNPGKALKSVEYITIHCTGNYSATATAKSHANFLYSGSSTISWHYTVDSGSIWQHFEDRQSCWHAGDTLGNMTSIGIEICVNDKSGFKKACQNAAWLVAELLRKHKLGIDRVIQHYRWNGKNCPAELRSGAWGVTWADFLAMVKANIAPPLEPKASYCVQVGAFSVKANAEAELAKVKAAGCPKAIIKQR